MWDRDADGYARGDGVASVVLKTLSEALAANDVIECVIRETGINQDGRTKGITMPSPIAQAALIRETYAKANLDLSKPCDRPQFFEAHGTGTPAVSFGENLFPISKRPCDFSERRCPKPHRSVGLENLLTGPAI